MNTRMICTSLVFMLLVWQAASAQPEPARILPSAQLTAGQEKQPDKDKKPDPDKKQPDKDKKTPEKKDLLGPPQTDVFAPAANDMGQVLPGFTPNMMGWVPPIYFANRTIPVTGLQTSNTVINNQKTIIGGNQTTPNAVTQPRTLLVPVGARASFAVAENSSPMPQDRVFFTWNNYSAVTGPATGSNLPQGTTQTVTRTTLVNGVPTTTTTNTTTVLPGAPSVTANREVFGFEKTFFDGRASVGMRLPLLQQPSSLDGFGANNVGDLTVVGTYAFYVDRTTGNVISGGLGVTAPTGGAVVTDQGDLRSVLLQPFVAYIWNANDRCFVQAFHSLVVPTDSRDVTLLFNDVGLGYRLYTGDGSRFLTSIVPSLEVHVATPLNHRGAANDPVVVPDTVALTAGVHFGLGRNAILTLGTATPVSAPRVYNVEGFVQLNWRY